MLFTYPCSCGKFILVEEGSARQFFCPDCGRIHEMPARAVPAKGGPNDSAAQGPAPALSAGKVVEAGDVLPESISLAPAEESPINAEEVIDKSPYALRDKPAPPAPPPRASRARAGEDVFQATATPETKPASAASTAIVPTVVPSAAPIPAAEILAPDHPLPPTALPVATPLPQAKPVTAIQVKSAAATQDTYRTAATAEAPAAPQEPELRLSKRDASRRYWERLIVGLALFYAQFLTNLVTMTILMLGITITALVEDEAKPRFILVLSIVTNTGYFFAGPVLAIVGGCFSTGTHEKVASRGLAIATLVLSAAPLLFNIGFASIFACFGVPALAGAMSLIGLLALHSAWICLLLFLKEVAGYMEMILCVEESNRLIFFDACLMGVPFVILALAWALAGTFIGPYITMLLCVIWLIILSKFTLELIQLISSIRQAIRTRERV